MKEKMVMADFYDNAATFKLPQRFNAETPREIIAELQALPHTNLQRVALDMNELEFMDSSGIGVLVYLYKELTARAKVLTLIKPNRNIYNLLMETGLDKLFDVELSSGFKKAAMRLDDADMQMHIAEETVGGVCVITLSGVMNYPAGSSLFKKHALPAVAVSGKILFDFKDLAYFDGLCVGSVLRVCRLLADNGGEMRICGANHVIRNVFQGMGLDALVPFFEDRESALDKWE